MAIYSLLSACLSLKELLSNHAEPSLITLLTGCEYVHWTQTDHYSILCNIPVLHNLLFSIASTFLLRATLKTRILFLQFGKFLDVIIDRPLF